MSDRSIYITQRICPGLFVRLPIHRLHLGLSHSLFHRMDPTDVFFLHYLGLVLNLLFYAMYCVCFVGNAWVLFKRRRMSRKASPFVDICTWALFLFATIHCVTTVLFRYKGLIVLKSQPDAALRYLSNMAGVLSLIRINAYALAAAFVDLLLIYRLWTVWGRWWAVIVLPIVMIIVNVVGAIILFYFCAIGNSETFNPHGVGIWSTVINALTAATNVYCGGLIAMRIYRESMNPTVAQARIGRGLQPILYIIVESATVYTVLTLLIMALILARIPAYAVLMDIIPPIAGISSCLLIIRIGFNMATDTVSSGRSGPQRLSFMPRSNPGSSAEEVPPLKVNVTRHALVSRDSDLGVVSIPDVDLPKVEVLPSHSPCNDDASV